MVFGADTGGSPAAPQASAPSEVDVEEGASQSTVDHGGHGGDTPGEAEEAVKEAAGDTGKDTGEKPATGTETEAAGANTPEANGADADTGAPQPAGGSENLAETGGDSTTPYIAAGGAAILAAGAAVMFATVRRRAQPAAAAGTAADTRARGHGHAGTRAHRGSTSHEHVTESHVARHAGPGPVVGPGPAPCHAQPMTDAQVVGVARPGSSALATSWNAIRSISPIARCSERFTAHRS